MIRIHELMLDRSLAKPTVLGNQLGLGAIKLQRQNRKFIKSWGCREDAKDTSSSCFLKVEVFKTEIKNKAYLQRYLIDEFGRIQYFYDVFVFQWSKKMGKWHRREGEGAREPVAFRVQGTAFGALQLSMLEFEEIGFNEEMNFCNSIHDSLVFMPEVGKLNRCIEMGTKVLAKPCSKLVNEATGLLGLVIGTEVAVGRNWRAWDKDSNSEGMKEIKI